MEPVAVEMDHNNNPTVHRPRSCEIASSGSLQREVPLTGFYFPQALHIRKRDATTTPAAPAAPAAHFDHHMIFFLN